jgi:pimeloyl-ACP methyl ester carboxylesterase
MNTRSAVDATAGYYQASASLRLFRVLLGASQKLWPALAVRAAARLFATPLPPKWLQRKGAWDASWQIAHWPFEEVELTLYAQPAAPHGPVALLVHGWGGHARQMLQLADTLAQQGYRPVLLEMPAHGRSRGSWSNLPQFARAIDYAIGRLQQEGHRVGLLAGHSLGANAAAYAMSRGLAVDKLVLLAPPASPRAYTRYFAQVFGLSEATRAAMQRRIEASEGVLMQHFDARAVAPRITVPTLVVHDRDDRINAFADGRAYAHAIQGAQLVATEGLGHRRLLKEPGVLAQVAVFATR